MKNKRLKKLKFFRKLGFCKEKGPALSYRSPHRPPAWIPTGCRSQRKANSHLGLREKGQKRRKIAKRRDLRGELDKRAGGRNLMQELVKNKKKGGCEEQWLDPQGEQSWPRPKWGALCSVDPFSHPQQLSSHFSLLLWASSSLSSSSSSSSFSLLSLCFSYSWLRILMVGLVSTGSQERKPCWLRCLLAVEFCFALSCLFSQRLFPFFPCLFPLSPSFFPLFLSLSRGMKGLTQ